MLLIIVMMIVISLRYVHVAKCAYASYLITGGGRGVLEGLEPPQP